MSANPLPDHETLASQRPPGLLRSSTNQAPADLTQQRKHTAQETTATQEVSRERRDVSNHETLASPLVHESSSG
jgi:hypothetical protein